ncbi:alpha/beta hydrolase [Elioraea rosea]|uniref:alpha/beta hydrolase n=1 Tax=Elioraea rosea TaxID=2492390 RepID=UPI001951128A|nr:alpha/beta hydrolase [Elioraea rosea]
MTWREMDRETLDRAYNNAGAVADSQQWLAGWRELGATRRAMPGAVLDQAYGPRERNRIDLFPSGAKDAPLMLFFHGGYWQRNAKEGFACMADGPLAHGIDVALAGYTLCPDATMTEVVAEAQAAVAWLVANARGLGFGMRTLVLSGWSAGGHLAASCATNPAVDAALLISGVYDLAPVQAGGLNDALRMDPAEAERLSPMRHIAPSRVRFTVTWGGDELPELRRQSADYAAAWVAAGNAAEAPPVPGANHFSILDELVRADGVLTRAVVSLVG